MTGADRRQTPSTAGLASAGSASGGAHPLPNGAALSARVEALSPRRLMALSVVFVAALAAILFGKLQDEAGQRRTETLLRVTQASFDCATRLNVAIMTGDSTRGALAACHPGGAAAVFYVSRSGDILGAQGVAGRQQRTGGIDLPATLTRALPLEQPGSTTIELASGKALLAWRTLDTGEAALVAAPAADLYRRTPLWITYLLLLASIALVIGSLMAGFIWQSQAAARAAGAITALKGFNLALAAGRCSPWTFESRERTVRFTRSLLEPLGLGSRDRAFTLRELAALVHPQDLRAALAIVTGDTSGVTEGLVRLRDPSGGWSRTYFRTSPDATRFERSGVAFDLSGARTLTPSAAIAESRLKDAIESIPEAFVLWDAGGRLVVWNRRFASIFRLSSADLAPGMSAEDVAAAAKQAGAVAISHFAPDAAVDEESIEVELPRDRWLQISRRRTSEGGVVCVASNITEHRRRARAHERKEGELERIVADLEASRRDLSETMLKYQYEKHRAEEASRSKSEFLANMSHELRTPLNAINGFTEVMKAEIYGPLGDPKYREYVGDILASGQHLLELIDDVLDMSKIEAGRLTLSPKKVELGRILEESARLVAKRALDAGIALKVSVGHAPAVWADARAAKQVTLNLLSNAIKFTPPGGEITLTAEADLDGVTVIVSDSGCGIDKSQMGRLGQPFELVEDHFSKSRRGSGLGLALSRSLMELMGGILALASQPGKGTVACATFPRRKDARVRLPQFIRSEAHVLTPGEARPAPAIAAAGANAAAGDAMARTAAAE